MSDKRDRKQFLVFLILHPAGRLLVAFGVIFLFVGFWFSVFIRDGMGPESQLM